MRYDISFPTENPIASITAPNGRGKTTILNLISFMFEPSDQTFNAIHSIPFGTFKCILSNGRTVELKKTELDSTDKPSHPSRPTAIREQTANRVLRSRFESGDFVFTIFNGKKQVSTPVVFSRAFSDAVNIDPQEYLDEDDEDWIRNMLRVRVSRMTMI